MIDFREGVLRGRLRAPENVHGWIQARALDVERLEPATIADLGWPPAVRSLDYVDDEGGARRVAVGRPNAELTYLEGLSAELSFAYAWSPAGATVFVLTGLTPEVPGIRAELHPQPRELAASRLVVLTTHLRDG